MTRRGARGAREGGGNAPPREEHPHPAKPGRGPTGALRMAAPPPPDRSQGSQSTGRSTPPRNGPPKSALPPQPRHPAVHRLRGSPYRWCGLFEESSARPGLPGGGGAPGGLAPAVDQLSADEGLAKEASNHASCDERIAEVARQAACLQPFGKFGGDSGARARRALRGAGAACPEPIAPTLHERRTP